ncbi:MAG: potassium channel family protein [Actinomycetota bacterium]
MTEAVGRPHVLRRLLHALVDPQSYGLVLLLIIASYVLSVSLTAPRAASLVLFVQIGTVWIALRTAKAHPRVLRLAFVLMAVAAIAAVAGAIRPDDTRPFVFFLSCVLYFIAPISIVRHLAQRSGVDQETMLGAIAAYLLLGMFYAFLYRTIGELQDAPFFGIDGEGTMPQVLFFSFTTLSTTGYGNLVPAGNPGQTFAVTEMVLGQLFLITAVGKIVTEWRPKRWQASDGSARDAEPSA